MSDDSLMVEGRKYLSSKRSAELFGYSTDYIGELCREGKVASFRKGRQWFVEEKSLFSYLEGAREKTALRKRELSLHLSRQLGREASQHVSSGSRVRSFSLSITRRIGNLFASRRAARAGIASVLILSIFFARAPIARAGLEDFSLASILRITRSVTDDLTLSFKETLDKTGDTIAALADKPASLIGRASVSVRSAAGGLVAKAGEVRSSVSAAVGSASASVIGAAHDLASFPKDLASSVSAAAGNAGLGFKANLLAAISFGNGFDGFTSGLKGAFNNVVDKVTDALNKPASVDKQPQNGSESASGGGATSVPAGGTVTTKTDSSGRTIVERVIERITRVETPVIQNITQTAPATNVVGGVSTSQLELRLQEVSNQLRSEIGRISGASSAQISSVYQIIGQATRIDNLSGTVITSPSISGGSISGTSFSGTITDSTASLSALTLGTATTTADNGFDITSGCFAVNGVCIGSGGSGDVSSGSQGFFPYYDGTGTTLSATSSIYISQGGNIGIGTTSPSTQLGVQGNALISGTLTTGNLTATGTVTFASGLGATSGGTGQTTFTTGDILYASGANTLAKLAVGSNGLVLKLVGGVPSWAADLVGSGGGGGGLFATTTNDMVIYPVDTTDILVLGSNATSTTGTILEVTGNTRLIGELRVTSSTTLQNLTATNVTSTNATSTSIFASTASSTNLFTSNFTLGRISGFLKATAGAVATALIDLASDVTGVLPVANGGTGWASLASGFIPFGNGSSAIATSSSLFWDSVTGRLGIGSTTPNAKLAVHANNGETNTKLFEVASSTASATSSLFVVSNNGNVGVGVVGNSLGAKLQTNGVIYANNAGDIGYALNSSGSNYGLLQNDSADTWSLGYKGVLNTGLGTSVLTWKASGLVGIGSTTPFAKLSVNPVAGDTNQFVVGSSTATAFLIDNSGKVGVGTTSPANTFSVSGNAYITTGLGIGVANPGAYGLSIAGKSVLVTGGIVQVQPGSAGSPSYAFSSDGTSGMFQPATSVLAFSTNSGEKLRITSTGNIGVGSTTPLAKLSVHANNGDTNTLLFNIASSTASATTSLFSISNTGVVTSNASATSTFAAGIQTTALDVTGATSTFANGIQLTSGCFRLPDGTCAGTGGGGGSGTVNSGTTGQLPYYASSGTTLTGTSALFLSSSNLFGIGSTTPNAKLSVHANNGDTNTKLFEVASSTASATSSLFVVTNTGNVGIGTGAPGVMFNVFGTTPIIRSQDSTNSGDFYANSGSLVIANNGNQALKFFNNGSEWARIDSTGLFGVGSTTPFAKLAVNPIAGDTNQFVVGSSTATSFIINPAGKVGVGTTSPSATFSVSGTSYLTRLGVGTSSPTNALTVFGGSSLTTNPQVLPASFSSVGSGSAVFLGSYTGGYGVIQGGDISGTATGQLLINPAGSAVGIGAFGAGSPASIVSVGGNASVGLAYYNRAAPTNGLVVQGSTGIGTSSPFAKLSVHANDGDTNRFIFDVASSTASATTSLFNISNAGVIGIGTTTAPYTTFVSNPLVSVAGSLQIGAAGLTNGIEIIRGAGGSAGVGRLSWTSSASSVLELANGSGSGELRLNESSSGFVTTYTNNIERVRVDSTGRMGIGSTSPFAKLSVHANNGETNTRLFEVASSTASATSSLFVVTNTGNVGIGTAAPTESLYISGSGSNVGASIENTGSGGRAYTWYSSNSGSGFGAGKMLLYDATGAAARLAVDSSGNLGVGSTSPWAKLAVNPVAGDTNQFVVGSSTVTSFIINPAGNVGIGLTGPARKLDVFEANATAQLRLSKSASLYSELTVDSTGDLQVSAAGGDIRSLTENLWICDGGSCPALTATSTAGNIFVENAVTFGNGFSFRQISVNELGLYNASSSLLLIFDQGN